MKPRRTAILASLALAAGALAPRSPAAAPRFRLTARDALVVIDVQKCFTAGGSLAVVDGDAVVPLINRVARAFRNVVVTQDWHTPDHVSFASGHPGRKPFETIELDYGRQVLWPDHCIQGTDDAALHDDLMLPGAHLLIRKGFHAGIDSYSAFLEADRKTRTGLAGYLRERGITRVFLAGLATDFCVAWTAIDARAAGFAAVVLEDACRAIDTDGSLAAAWKAMTLAGVVRAVTSQVG